jgi:hypothetical protein
MRVISGIFILIALFAGTLSAAAEPFRREVSFEWNEIPDAKNYDVEIRRVTAEGPAKPMSFKTTQAIWMGKLVPGKYTMSLRSLDARGVPGDWSPNSEFDVGLDPVAVKSPPDKAEIKANDDLVISQKLEWSPVGGAKEYRFELSSEDGKTQIVENITGTSYTAKIPVAQTYTMKVTGIGDNGMQSESPTVSTFSVLGKKLSPPKMIAPESEFVREVRWSKPAHVDKFDLTLNRYNPTLKKWEKVLTEENVDDTVYNFDAKQPGGVYSLQVKAHGKMRGTSEVAKINFKVVNGNRSPAAEYTALVRKSIDRVTGWYAIASYLITQINYRGETPETGGLTTTSALGGTGRLGAGYFTKDDRWGFIGIVDMSGFSISGSNHTYSSLELSGISRYVTSDRSESRLIAGLYYKELPQLIGTPSSSGPPVVDFIQSAVAGPHVGGEYWYSMNPKVGFQANAHVYYPLLTAKSPNGNNVEPRVSYQLGLMGSYRFNTHFTGLLGLTQRYDEVAYKANKTGSAFQSSGEYDVTQISGSYLSMFAEYGF